MEQITDEPSQETAIHELIQRLLAEILAEGKPIKALELRALIYDEISRCYDELKAKCSFAAAEELKAQLESVLDVSHLDDWHDVFEWRRNGNDTITIERFIWQPKIKTVELGGTNYTLDIDAVNVKIPGVLDGLPVTVIGPEAFKDSRIMSVAIPVTVTEIGDGAFSHCVCIGGIMKGHLWSTIEFIKGVASWQEGIRATDLPLIKNYSHSVRIHIPDSIIRIGHNAFEYCNIHYLRLGTGVQTIGNEAFRNNYFNQVELPSGLLKIGDGTPGMTFAYNNLREITIPDSVEYIGVDTFFGNNLSSVQLPPNLSDDVMQGFEGYLRNFYFFTNRAAGEYTKWRGMWRTQGFRDWDAEIAYYTEEVQLDSVWSRNFDDHATLRDKLIFKLRLMGWSSDEVAKAMHISEDEEELIFNSTPFQGSSRNDRLALGGVGEK